MGHFCGDPTALDAALQQAARQSPQQRVIEARLSRAEQLTRRAFAAYLPRIDLTGLYIRNSNEQAFTTEVPGTAGQPPQAVRTVIVPADQWRGSATVTQALVAPVLWAAIDNAALAQRVARMDSQNSLRLLQAEVMRLYLSAVALWEAGRVQDALLTTAKEREADARARFEAGAISKNSWLCSEIDRLRAEQDVSRALHACAAAKSALGAVLARDTDFEVEASTLHPIENVSSGPSASDPAERALVLRPDAQVARLSVDLAQGQRRETAYAYVPTLVGNGNYDLQNSGGFSGRHQRWFLGVQLNLTLWDGGLREAR